MAYNPRPQEGEILSNAQWKDLQNQIEAEKEKTALKPLPPAGEPLGKKLKYYVEVRRLGLKENDILTSEFKTANLKHVLRLLVDASYSVLYLKRSHDNCVIWDKK